MHWKANSTQCQAKKELDSPTSPKRSSWWRCCLGHCKNFSDDDDDDDDSSDQVAQTAGMNKYRLKRHISQITHN